MARTVTIVPHTHWDREWYSPFQTFRLRLVDLLDDLLPRLDEDPAYAHFLLDGQMAVVDDYLAIRPEAAYFAVGDGQRTLFLVVNAEDASELPRLVEPFWLAFEADIEVTPVMSQADFEKAAVHIAEAAKKF